MGEGAMYTVSLSEPFQWKKIGKVANQANLVVPSHSEPLLWEKIGKVANQIKLAVLSHFSGKRLEKLQLRQNPTFLILYEADAVRVHQPAQLKSKS